MGSPGLGSWIERRATSSPSDVALVVDGASRTYADLAADVRRVAQVLRRRGIGPGDRVAYHGRNDPVALSSLFGSTAIGAVWVPIHPARPDDEVRAVLDDAEPRILIRAQPRSHPETPVPELEAADLSDDDLAPEPLPTWEPDPGDLADPRVHLGHDGAAEGRDALPRQRALERDPDAGCGAFASTDVTLAAAPFTGMGGLGVTVLPTWFAGGAVVVPPATDGPTVLATIEQARVTVVFANPDLLEGMVRAPGWSDADLSSVRTGVAAAELVPEELLRAYLDRGVRLRHGYGLTEAAPVVSLLDEREALTRADSVGKPLPFVDVRAVRPDGSVCEPGETGAWWIRRAERLVRVLASPTRRRCRRLVPDRRCRLDRRRWVPHLPRPRIVRDGRR